MTLTNWNRLKENFGDFFYPKFVDKNFILSGDIITYQSYLRGVIENFKNELEVNFLNMPNAETRDMHIQNCYEEIITQLRLNKEHMSYIETNEKSVSKKEIRLNLLIVQNDELFGLTFWFKTNLSFEKIFGINSIVIRAKKMIDEKTDNRIKGKLKKEEIQEYFLIEFSKKQIGQEPILSEDQISYFLHANFFDFNPMVEIKKFNTPVNLQGIIRKAVYRFHQKHNATNRTADYVKLLLSNFSAFDNTEFSVLSKNFSK